MWPRGSPSPYPGCGAAWRSLPPSAARGATYKPEEARARYEAGRARLKEAALFLPNLIKLAGRLVRAGQSEPLKVGLNVAFITDLPAVQEGTGNPAGHIAGIIGTPLLARTTARFDFAAKTLTLFLRARAPLPPRAGVKEVPWRPVPDAAAAGSDALACDFSTIRVVCDRRLDLPDLGRLAGCLAYALKATLAGEELGEPSVEFACSPGGLVAFTVVEFAYDASRSIRTEPDPIEAFRTAREYLLNGGTPVRTTNREGPGMQGTQLVEGLSALCTVAFYVR